ncbi:hypothetical protein [Chitinimonas naiadis]
MSSCRPLCLVLLLAAGSASAEWQGLLDLRAVHAQGAPGWLEAGMGKQRIDSRHDGLRLGQAMLVGRGELIDELTGTVVLNAADDRRHLVDITEAYLNWKPIPQGPWRSRVRLGAFFPAMSLENDGLAWTTTRTLSASAVNSWIGEEFRTLGLEYTLSRPGVFVGTPHDLSLTAALFQGNDPSGTLLAWRGWAIGDRITGLTETLVLPNLPVYRPDGQISRQDAEVDNFRELDHRPGYYLLARYGYAGRWAVGVMHYDNRGDPLVVKRGQYAWDTHFSHIDLRYLPGADWEVLAQALGGKTSMGPRAVYLTYRAWYVLLAKHFGENTLAIRYDHFLTHQNDRLPADNNDENGHGLTLSYTHAIDRQWRLTGEWLHISSTRPARSLIGQAPYARDDSLTLALRWQF